MRERAEAAYGRKNDLTKCFIKKNISCLTTKNSCRVRKFDNMFWSQRRSFTILSDREGAEFPVTDRYCGRGGDWYRQIELLLNLLIGNLSDISDTSDTSLYHSYQGESPSSQLKWCGGRRLWTVICCNLSTVWLGDQVSPCLSQSQLKLKIQVQNQLI